MNLIPQNKALNYLLIRERCELKEGVVTKIKKSMLKWFGHVDRISERRLIKGIYVTDESGNAGRKHPRKTYPDLIGEVLQKGRVRTTHNPLACMNVDKAKGVCKDRSRWRSVVSVYPHGKNARDFGFDSQVEQKVLLGFCMKFSVAARS